MLSYHSKISAATGLSVGLVKKDAESTKECFLRIIGEFFVNFKVNLLNKL